VREIKREAGVLGFPGRRDGGGRGEGCRNNVKPANQEDLGFPGPSTHKRGRAGTSLEERKEGGAFFIYLNMYRVQYRQLDRFYSVRHPCRSDVRRILL